MIRRSSRALTATAIAAVIFLQPSAAHAADEEATPDARLVGYEQKVDIGGSTTMSYALMFVLCALAVGITFKASGRTHLD